METTMCRYMVMTTLFSKLEQLLNDIENMASGQYEIVSIFDKQHVGERSTVGVVVKFHVELVFDEEEIKKRLGFSE